MIVIVDYGVGNLGSMANMFKKVGVEAVVSSDSAVIERATSLVLPGVGAFDNGMESLAKRGLVELLSKKVLCEKTPVLGVCLGMQLFARASEEGALPGLGWIAADTIKFNNAGRPMAVKVPHMGWNTVEITRPHPVLADLPQEPRFYFVHSYHLRCDDEAMVLTTSWHGYEFVSSVAVENIVGIQFHPEKSHRFGMQVIRNFARWNLW